jgi:hypothetical protein
MIRKLQNYIKELLGFISQFCNLCRIQWLVGFGIRLLGANHCEFSGKATESLAHYTGPRIGGH